MDKLFSTENLVALLTLTALEIVLGIDNIVFLSIITGKLPKEQQPKARTTGLVMAMLMRIGLLLAITWVMGLTRTLVSVFHHDVSGKDLILFVGGLFLVAKATHEIHNEVEASESEADAQPKPGAFFWVIVQIVIVDLVFSLDSIITAIGMADDIEIMIAAVVIAIGVMYVSSGPVAAFVKEHPTTKMLALAFLVLIGVALVADGFHFHIPRSFIYVAICFSAAVEFFNILAKRNRRKIAKRS